MSTNSDSIKIKLKAYDHKIIDASVRQIIDQVIKSGAKVIGPIPLPTHKSRYTVIRSPHVFKDSREHFEMRTHKRLLTIVNSNQKTVESLMNLSLPSGVDIQVKM